MSLTAEQMLQGIDQRLKTAESSLGSGGAKSVSPLMLVCNRQQF